MKRNLIPLIVLFICLTGCKNNPKEVILTGEIKGLGNDSIYIYGNDEFSDFIDVIYTEDGKFTYTTTIDTTLIQAMLLINGQESYPIYLGQGEKIKIKGESSSPGFLEIKGNKLNEELTEYNRSIQNLEEQSDGILKQKAEEFITKHSASLLCVYLLDKYFVQTDSQDLPKIKQLIELMDGSLQDKPYIEELTKEMDQNIKSEINKTAPVFSLLNTEKKNISRINFTNKYLLIHFWASWCDSCRTSNEELKRINKTYVKKEKSGKKKNKPNTEKDKPDEGLAILGISLDLNKADWLETIKKDTLKWEQVCDFSGWDSYIVKQYAILEIPYNILIDPQGKIIARGLRGEQLNQELKKRLKPEKQKPQSK